MSFIFKLQTKVQKNLTRPIQRIDGQTYSATWLPGTNESGKPSTACVIFDSDFQNFCSDAAIEGHKPLTELPFAVDFDGEPWPETVLSVDAYQDHVLGDQPIKKMGAVFTDVSSSIDSFVAFDNSFANQQDLSDFLACWTISTYATDVFDTVGYIWPTGEKASGKTQCLKTLMSLSFMGTTVASSSSFASIRDEACLGATIGFDDCENIKHMDHNKRELLLAGNTKGTYITLKVQGKREGDWDKKRVDAFAPRAFTSIRIPDDVLGSRTILIPLVRSNDPEKTRRKPTSASDWAISPEKIRDDIWLNVVQGLGEIEDCKQLAAQEVATVGRDFDIFQPVLTVAYWLEEHHQVDGLFGRMVSVMEAYHQSRHENQLPSLEELVLRVLLLECSDQNKVTITTSKIENSVHALCGDLDITEEALAQADAQKIGLLLRRLGFEKNATHGNARSWNIKKELVEKRALSAGVPIHVEAPSLEFQLPESEPETSTMITAKKPW